MSPCLLWTCHPADNSDIVSSPQFDTGPQLSANSLQGFDREYTGVYRRVYCSAGDETAFMFSKLPPVDLEEQWRPDGSIRRYCQDHPLSTVLHSTDFKHFISILSMQYFLCQSHAWCYIGSDMCSILVTITQYDIGNQHFCILSMLSIVLQHLPQVEAVPHLQSSHTVIAKRQLEKEAL